MLRNRVDLWILAGALLLIGVLSALRASQGGVPSVASTYDTGVRGYAALYELLAREGVPAGRFEAAPSALFARRGTLAATGERFSTYADWVRGGGTLVLLGGFPGHGKTRRVLDGDTGLTAQRIGRGVLVYAPSETIFDNAQLENRGRAALAYKLFAALPAPLAFDERNYGHSQVRTFWQVLPLPMRLAIFIAGGALLLAAIGANLPFAPPRVPPAGPERDSGEYIEALARMLERGHANAEIVERLCREVISLVRTRAAGDADARDLLQRAEYLQSLPYFGRENVLAAGALFARARKDYA